MHRSTRFISAAALTLAFLFSAYAEVDSTFHIYLLFGQSNMAGGCNHSTVAQASIDRQPEDCDTTDRIKVLAWGDCSNTKSGPCPDKTINRTHDEWYTAFPPLHKCKNGASSGNGTEGIGPADYFGKTLLDSIRKDISIGFVPCALSGQNIAVYEKGKYATIDDHTRPIIDGKSLEKGAYEWMVGRCILAQKSGVIKGILFHQGEANTNESSWPGRVAQIVKDLRDTLKLGEDVPFLAGEVLRTGDAAAHNTQVGKIPDVVPNSAVVSAEGLELRPGDQWRLHFSCASVREFGKRYAKEFLKLASHEFVPRINDSIPVHTAAPQMKPVSAKSVTSEARIFSLNGRAIKTANKTTSNVRMTTPGVYIVIDKKSTNNRTTMVPFIQD